jgi:hypothetical protein
MRKIRTFAMLGALAILGGLYADCTEKVSVNPKTNQPPETHLFLQFQDTLQMPGETVSMQVLYWYGDDPDGEVSGFEYQWDYDSTWIFTTAVMDTFFVPIRQPQDTFTFVIRAIDNEGAIDLTPDRLSFPIRNSPPVVTFPIDFVQRYSRNTYNCFSYFSIGWSSSDPDGDATITGYDWYLADSSFAPWDSIVNGQYYWNAAALDTMTWGHLDSLASLKIFDDLLPGSYRFFLRCVDVAGAYSNIIFYPDKAGGGVWNVMPVVGTALFIDDDRYAPALDTIIPLTLAEINPAGFSSWDIIDRVSYYPRDLEATLRLFDIVIWHGGSYPHFREAADAVTRFVASGGDLLVFSTHANADTTIYPFLPIADVDTAQIGRSFEIIRVSGVGGQYPDTMKTNAPGYPVWPLTRSYGFTPGSPAALIPGPVQALYTQAPTMRPDLIDTVAARYPAFPAPADIIYFSMELFACQADFHDLLSYILEEEFADEGR